jgi:hypothetical protein
MDDRARHDRVMAVPNLRDYFRTSIDDVIARQGVELDPHATCYVVNLMTLFSRSEEFYEDDGETYGLKPLALMLADAADAPSAEKRNQSLQRIGDVALFIAGFFIESLARKAVDVDYYVHMGGNAYGSLSDEIRGSVRGDAFAPVYRELAVKFQVLVDVLNEVKDGARAESDVDIVRNYELWRKTGSRRAEQLLREQGVIPITEARGARRH